MSGIGRLNCGQVQCLLSNQINLMLGMTKTSLSILFFVLMFSASNHAKDVLSDFFQLSQLPQLPQPVANNAVALINIDNQEHLISFMGLGVGKAWKDVHNKAWSLALPPNVAKEVPTKSQWQIRTPVPSTLTLKGRLASVAIGVDDKAYLFGGYTVAEDHTEVSSPDNFAYDLKTDAYKFVAPTPVPTDDAIALPYQNRYIYLISGWHNDGNVNLAQVYDIKTNQWQQASPFPGEPVFGHAGGIVGNQMVVCDGVKVQARLMQRRTFKPVSACYLGIIDPKNPYKIEWQLLAHPTNKGKYRMAAAGVTLGEKAESLKGVLFVGGSDNPYNYNGVGYDGVPSKPSNNIWFFDLQSKTWSYAKHSVSTMDHRGLLVTEKGNNAYIVGGMGKQQKVLKQVTQLDLSAIKFSSAQPEL